MSNEFFHRALQSGRPRIPRARKTFRDSLIIDETDTEYRLSFSNKMFSDGKVGLYVEYLIKTAPGTFAWMRTVLLDTEDYIPFDYVLNKDCASMQLVNVHLFHQNEYSALLNDSPMDSQGVTFNERFKQVVSTVMSTFIARKTTQWSQGGVLIATMSNDSNWNDVFGTQMRIPAQPGDVSIHPVRSPQEDVCIGTPTPDAICSGQFEPWIGCDGQTYSNKCSMEAAGIKSGNKMETKNDSSRTIQEMWNA
jgi:hypothetical protein